MDHTPVSGCEKTWVCFLERYDCWIVPARNTASVSCAPIYRISVLGASCMNSYLSTIFGDRSLLQLIFHWFPFSLIDTVTMRERKEKRHLTVWLRKRFILWCTRQRVERIRTPFHVEIILEYLFECNV